MIWMINVGKPTQQRREIPMRLAFTAPVACFLFCASAAAGETSVLNHGGEVTPPAIAVESAPAPTIVAAPCCSAGACAAPAGRVRARYRVVERSCDACTGQPVRDVTRGVVRGTGEVIRDVGATAVNVITLPARVCRAGRRN
jgi:hypothetical protein